MKRSGLGRTLLIAGAGAITFMGAALGGRTASATSEEREMRAISRAVFAGGRLWMLHDDGALVSLRPDDAKPERDAIGGRAVDICRSKEDLLAIVATGSGHWIIQRRSPGGWKVAASVPIENDNLAALGCALDSTTVALVTNRRLLEVEDGQVRAVTLTRTLEPPFAIGTAMIGGDAIWVGFNIGEWGGGLRRIDRTDGRSEIVEHNRSGQLCGGPLNTACDPVNGIVPSPTNPSCVVAAIGLVHMMSHGRIIEVCDKSVRRLYFKPLASQLFNGQPDDGEPGSTIAFFSLARSGDSIWALGIDGLYRFDGAKPPQFRPLPKFEDRGGYQLSFDVPGIVLVMTDVNQRRSLSGAVPVMAVR